MPMPGRGRLVTIAAGVAVVALIAWILMPQPVAVETATVTRGAFEKTVDEDGRTRVRERYVVSAPLAGRLLRVDIKAGDAIARGQALATLLPATPALLDARTEQALNERVGVADAEHLRAEANVERARVALDLARSEFTRNRDLATQGFLSKQALERSQREVDLKVKEAEAADFDRHAAEHQRALARAALARARGGGAVGERWKIVSPVDGRVLRVAQESEAVVAVGAAIVELGDPRNLEIVVDVLTADATLIKPGAAAHIDVGSGHPPFEGRVRLVEPSAFTKVSALGIEEQRVNVVIDPVAPDEQWSRIGDGYRVDARIVAEQRSDAVLVPLGAVFRERDAWAAYVLDGARARLKALELGPRNATHAVVRAGLVPGEAVVVYPGDAVADGVKVAPAAR